MSAYGSQAPPVAGYYSQQPPQVAPPASGYYSQQPQQVAPSYSYQQENKPQQYGQSNSIDENKINQNPKYNDIWAAVLFMLCLISFAVLAYFGINEIKGFLNSSSSNSDTSIVLGISFAVALGSGFIITVVYFFLMQSFAGKMIWVTGVLSILIWLAAGAFFLVIGALFPGAVMVVFALIYAWLFYSWRHRIPFAKVMLKTVTRVTGQFPATMFSGFIGLCFEVGFGALFILSVGGWAIRQNSSSVTGVYIYLAFCFYWCSEVVRNAVHVTVSGLFATVYFMGTSDQTRKFKVTVPVANPTAKSAKRALTTSFGSICYGSLIIALIQTLRTIIQSSTQQARQEDCILSIIESIVQYFNKYAFTQVAIYGKDFCTAGKDTWSLIKSRGIDAIINDSLIGNVLGFGQLLTGVIAGVLAGLTAAYLTANSVSNLGSPQDGTQRIYLAILVGVFGFVTGSAEFGIVAEVINSGVATIFVCLAEDPHALQRTQPELFQKVVEVYPQVIV